MPRTAPKDQFSPKQVGQALGVSEASVKRWCDQRRIESVRTAGGHRRVPVRSVVAFLRASGRRLVRPTALGLPPVRGAGNRSVVRSRELLAVAFESGDSDTATGLAVNLYVGGHAAAAICDQCVAPVFHSIGEGWDSGRVEIYQERRACQIALRLVHTLRELLPPVSSTAPVACGGTLRGDPYTLATSMVELALREAGWAAQSYGSGLPVGTVLAALAKDRPRLFWLSVSAFDSPGRFLEDYGALQRSAASLGIPVVVGGRALDAKIRREMVYSAFSDTLRHITAFAAALPA